MGNLPTADASPPPRHVIANDADSILIALPGAAGTMFRSARGSGSSAVTAIDLGPVQLTVMELGFPMVGEAYAEADGVVFTTIMRLPGPGRWDGQDLEAGQTHLYGPGQGQIAHDPEGFVLGLTTISRAAFDQAAADLGVDPEPATGKRLIDRDDSRATFSRMFDDVIAGVFDPDDPLVVDRILGDAVGALHAPHVGPCERSRRLSSVDLVREVCDFLGRSGVHSAPVLTLARAVGVSERRLHLAFQQVLGIGPNAFMRQRALDDARRRLLHSDPSNNSVSAIAVDHGFAHVGRFASFYHRTFGELPSATLRSNHSDASSDSGMG